MPAGFASYGEFWRYYLSDHLRPPTRALHYFSNAFAVMLVVKSALDLDPLVLAGAIMVSVIGGWLADLVVERRGGATFAAPLWSYASSWRMTLLWFSGRLQAAYRTAGVID